MCRIHKLAVAVWLSVIASIILFAVFWRVGFLRPHAGFSVACMAIMIGTFGLLTTAITRDIRNGYAVTPAIGWLLIGATPLVWLCLYFVVITADLFAGAPYKINPALRVAMTWASSVIDVEARYRYSRWTIGNRSILLDNKQTPNPSALVEQMDAHIEGMANLLGEQSPRVAIPWVRGSLMGQEGRAIFQWAICRESDANELAYIEYHEVAHALMSTLSDPDHDPPMLLFEGWADSQSKDRETLISRLATDRRNGSSLSLKELVSPYWYGLGEPTIYIHGSVFVLYLIETYGGEQFFKLYNNARRVSFLNDWSTILGVSFEDTELAFWVWFSDQVRRLEEQRPDPAAPGWSIAADVDQDTWNAFLTQFSDRSGSRARVPENTGIRLTCKIVGSPANTQSSTDGFEFEGVFEDEQSWVRSGDRVLMASASCCAELWRVGDSWHGWTHGSEAKGRISNEISRTLSNLIDGQAFASEPFRISPQWFEEQATLIHSVSMTDAPVRWTVTCTRRRRSNDPGSRYEFEIAPENDWIPTLVSIVQPNKSTIDMNTTFRHYGGVVFPSTSNVTLAPRQSYSMTLEVTEVPVGERRNIKEEVERTVLEANVIKSPKLRVISYLIALTCPLVGMLLARKRPVELKSLD